MNWHRVIAALQEYAKQQLTEAKTHADEGSVTLGTNGLITANVLLGIADALSAGLRGEQ